jgi:hypothetical protein
VGAWAQPWKTTTLDAPVRVDLKMATRVGYDEGQGPRESIPLALPFFIRVKQCRYTQ